MSSIVCQVSCTFLPSPHGFQNGTQYSLALPPPPPTPAEIPPILSTLVSPFQLVPAFVPSSQVSSNLHSISTSCHLNFTASQLYITKASCQAWLKLLFANEVRIGGPGGGRFKTDHFEALPQLNRVASVVDFEADVPGGNWVTVGFDSPWSVQ